MKQVSPVAEFTVSEEQREWLELAAGIASIGSIHNAIRELIDDQIEIAKRQGIMK